LRLKFSHSNFGLKIQPPNHFDDQNQNGNATTAAKPTAFTGVHATSFKDMLLKPELLQSITDCGFEHPSDVQQRCIPVAILG
jgi:ATP-dependent RNA helicase UAP56/SUB2